MLQSRQISRKDAVIPGETEQPERASGERFGAVTIDSALANKTRLSTRALSVVPLAAAVALVIHLFLSTNEPAAEGRTYTLFLSLFFAVAVAFAITQRWWPALRARMRRLRPIFTVALLLLCAWQVITSGFRLLPLPYFPSPAGVLQSMINDRALLFDSTWHSLILLLSGYTLGVIAGFITGVCIGWSAPARYWGMPILKVVGPIISAAALIALAVWFPVTMLTASGVSNTRASYLDVARTLGAGPRYLIFRVAIPAALPTIFVGLFMGLGASFLTLVVAESVGVKSGLGWYVSWAQGWAEYGKVYAALIIMAAFFSTIMTLLFKLRDRVLIWQKGMIRW